MYEASQFQNESAKGVGHHFIKVAVDASNDMCAISGYINYSTKYKHYVMVCKCTHPDPRIFLVLVSQCSLERDVWMKQVLLRPLSLHVPILIANATSTRTLSHPHGHGRQSA